MKKKNYIIGLFSLLMIMSLVSMAQAVNLITFPLEGGVARNDTYTVYMETTLGMTQCQLHFSDLARTGFGATNTTNNMAIGTNSTLNVTNSSVAQTNFTFVINTNAIEDGNNYNISVECSNSSATGSGGGIDAASATGIIVDNTRPTGATALTSSVTSSNPTLTATATDSNTRQCRIDWSDRSPISGVDPVYALASNTCTFSLTNAVDGTFGYKVVTSDGTNETNSAETFLKIDSLRDENRPPALKEALEAKPSVAEASKGAMGIISSFFSRLGALLKSWFS